MAWSPGADYYTVLGIPEDAPPEAVERAYRERVKQVHPDHSDAPDARERFRTVREARRVLGDPDERDRYDRVGHGAYTGQRVVGPEPVRQRARPEHRATQRAAAERERERRAAERPRDFAVHQTADLGPTDPVFGVVRRRTALGVAAFLLYPGLLASALWPPFPLAVNVLVGCCTLVLVSYLLMTPTVALAVFGGWTLLTPFVLLFLGIPVLSTAAVLLLSASAIPAVMALSTLTVLRV